MFKQFLFELLLKINPEIRALQKRIKELSNLSIDLDKQNRLLRSENELLKIEIAKKDLQITNGR